MKVRKYQGSDEKTILTSMVVHDHVLGQIAREIGSSREDGPFANKWANLVARWCVEYHRKHRKAPRKLIRDHFEKWAVREQDEESVRLVEKFLSVISSEYESLERDTNPQWVLERAADHFAKVRLEKVAEGIEAALENGDLDAAKKIHSEFEPVSFSADSWLNPFSREEIRATLERREKAEPMVRFGGDLGRFLDDAFERDSFVSFAAPEKKGKSFWLQEVVWKAIKQRRKVLYYVLGDMSADQVKRRLYARMAKKPWKSGKPVSFAMPVKLRKGKSETGVLTLDIEAGDPKLHEPYNEVDVVRAVRRLRMNTALRKNPLRVKCAGAGMVSASDIEGQVRSLADDGFVPDVVVVDYSDLLAPEPGAAQLDFRHQIDATWKVLRRISTDHHILVVTATQAAARSYKRWLIEKGDFSEDKRKNAHVTGMLGINQTSEEKKRGIYRLNWVFLRDGEWTDTQHVWTVGHLGLGCPCFKSLL